LNIGDGSGDERSSSDMNDAGGIPIITSDWYLDGSTTIIRGDTSVDGGDGAGTIHTSTMCSLMVVLVLAGVHFFTRNASKKE
jgi:hypothetical protein